MGKNIIGEIYRSYGFQLSDLGKNVPVSLFLEKAQSAQPAIVGISTMMSTTINKVVTLMEYLKKDFEGIKVMVEGSFITPGVARTIGADGYANQQPPCLKKLKDSPPSHEGIHRVRDKRRKRRCRPTMSWLQNMGLAQTRDSGDYQKFKPTATLFWRGEGNFYPCSHRDG